MNLIVNKENLIELLDEIADDIQSQNYKEALLKLDNFTSTLDSNNKYEWINILGKRKIIIKQEKN